MTLTQNNNRWPIIVLAICAAAFFWDGILLNHAFLLRDTFCDFLPYRALQKRARAAGHLPVWNPFSGCGQPFLGDPQCAALYPLHVVFDVLPLPTALIVSQLLHTFIAACGAYLLARQWRCSKPAAIVSAIAYSIGTCQIAWMEFLYATCVLAWVPWVLWATGRVVTTRKSASIALLAFIVAVQYLGGNTELFAFSCIILGLYSIIVIPAHVGWRGAIRSWGAIAIAFVIAGATPTIAISPTPFILLLSPGNVQTRGNKKAKKLGRTRGGPRGHREPPSTRTVQRRRYVHRSRR